MKCVIYNWNQFTQKFRYQSFPQQLGQLDSLFTQVWQKKLENNEYEIKKKKDKHQTTRNTEMLKSTEL